MHSNMRLSNAAAGYKTRNLRIAMGRKVYLFAALERGGEVAATMYSLVATCKQNRIESFAYLKDVLGGIRSHRVDRLAELLPFNWSPARA